MATPLTAEAFIAALRAEGLDVVEVGAWRTHNRNHKGPWGPVNGVMIHHTVTKGSAYTVALCRDGHSALPGPLCHGVITKDGRVHLVGYGRANHAGSGDGAVLQAVVAEKALPADKQANTDGNPHFYGFECENLGDGKDPWPEAQLEAIEKVVAAICRAHGWTERSVIGHLEWQPGKVDPRGFTMAWMRGRVRDRLEAGNTPAPSTPAPSKPTTPSVPKMPAFPGRQYFKLGAANSHALQLQQWLAKGGWGPAYKVGPSRTMTQLDLDKVKALQRHYLSALGPADGLTGPKTWQYAYEVANGLRKK
ncbi:N-acetylmuramoyl-L-alanine amidase [Streptomyces griseoviridis]|uniref:N-acetylmuramoyl-L-alanine amidase n=1 Tax=Streptomyces griseoviridis TaxID=45398 RepID=UPI00344C7247